MNMPKHYKDMMDEIINKIDETKVKENAPTSADIERLKKQGLKTKTEDAPANAVAHLSLIHI